MNVLCPHLIVVAVGFIVMTCNACSGPCDKACENLVESCQQSVDSYTADPQQTGPSGCFSIEPSPELDHALCFEQCQDWQAEAAECLADLSCGEEDGTNRSAVAACMKDKGRSDGERDGDMQSNDCRADCDRQAQACGGACKNARGDEATCGACYDNCDRARARCRGWCKFIGS